MDFQMSDFIVSWESVKKCFAHNLYNMLGDL